MSKKETIFVQIASYRDPELVPTIKDLLQKASKPKNLKICVCRQYSESDGFDDLSEYENDSRFIIINVPYKETKGVCWARNLMQSKYSGEKYTLHLDSHHRFIENWDDELIKMIKDLQNAGYPKPLLTAYLPSYQPHNDPDGRAQEPWQMVFDRFIPEGAVFFKPETVKNWQERNLPVPGRFFSAHFCFTLGEFSKEVPHNPEYLFHGEEISIAARAYTWGYDIFHPHKLICWHEYTRSYRTQAWIDDINWHEKNMKSHLINKKLFGMDGFEQEGHTGEYGFGNIRSLRDYEKYAGILFSERSIQKYTLDNDYPPNPRIEDEDLWKRSFCRVFKHCIDISHSSVVEKDYDFWVIALHDSDNETIYRRDIRKEEIDTLLKSPNGYCAIWVEFQTVKQPKYWVVWPHSLSKGWCERMSASL